MMWFFLAIFFAFWTSISTLIAKRLLVRELHPATILLVSNLITLPFILTLVFLSGGIPNVSTKFYQFVLGSSAIDFFAFFASFFALKIAPISLVSPIASFNPAFTTIIAGLTLGEVPTATKLLGILLIVAGAYLLNVSDIKNGVFAPVRSLITNRGVQLAFIAYFLWAVTPIFQKQAIFETEPTRPIFASFFGMLLLTVFVSPFGLKRVVKQKNIVRENFLWLILPAPVHALAFWAAFTAFSLANLGYVTAIFKLSVLFTILWGWLFFREERIKERLLGGGVMLAGTILLVI